MQHFELGIRVHKGRSLLGLYTGIPIGDDRGHPAIVLGDKQAGRLRMFFFAGFPQGVIVPGMIIKRGAKFNFRTGEMVPDSLGSLNALVRIAGRSVECDNGAIMHESGWLNRGDQFLVEMEPGSKVEVSLVLPGSANPRDVRVRFDGTTIGLVDQEDFIEHFQ